MQERKGRQKRYHIPNDEEVTAAIIEVMIEKGTVHSQKRLRDLVSDVLRETDASYHVSERRVRHLAIASRMIHVEAHCYESVEEMSQSTCPVCSSKLTSLRNKTIFGGTVVLARECPVCGYWSGRHARVPVRYVFTLSRDAKRRLSTASKKGIL